MLFFLSPVVLSFIDANLQQDLFLPTSLLLPSYVAALHGDAHQRRFCSHFSRCGTFVSFHKCERTMILLLYIWVIPILYSCMLTLEYNKDFDTNRIDLQHEINDKYQYEFLMRFFFSIFKISFKQI